MLDFIDSHAHLADPAFDEDRGEVVERARAAGAKAIVCIGESLAAAARSRAIADEHRGFAYYTAGIHPHDASSFDAARDLPRLEDELRRGARAVGECGLDYHYDNSPRNAQRECFASQLELAHRARLPVVVHTRDAEDDTRDFLRSAATRQIAGVLHCFTGSESLARTALDAGWHISFSGIITFKKWTDDDLLRLIPDDRLLAESDAPYLAPVPNRGKRNESAWVPHTIDRLAFARRAAPETVGALVTANARRLFALMSPSTPALQ